MDRGERATHITIPYHVPLFAEHFSRIASELPVLRNRWTSEIVRPHFKLVPYPCEIGADTAVPIFERLMVAVEDALASALRPRSSYYWLHAYRRIAPKNTFSDDVLSTVVLYRRTLELAFFKYGHTDMDQDLEVGIDSSTEVPSRAGRGFSRVPGQFYLKNLTFEDFQTLCRVECLAHLFYLCTAQLRWLYKGAALWVAEDDDFEPRPTTDLERLVRSFDFRAQKYGASAGGVGVPLISGRRLRPSLQSALVPWPNIEGRSASELRYESLLGVDKVEELYGSPNLAWYLQDLRAYEQNHRFLGDAFSSRFKFTPADLVAFASTVSWTYLQTHQSLTPDARWTRLQTGYAVGDLTYFLRAWSENAKRFGRRIRAERLDAIVQWASYDARRCLDIDLWTRGPERLLLPLTNGRILIDLLALPTLLRDAAYELRNAVSNWTPKGPMFERFTASYLGALKKAKIWQRSKRLNATDGSYREIDLGLVVGSTMFVLDCLSLSRSVAFDQGKPDALAFRKEKFTEKLERVDSLAAWLKDHPHGRNYKLPRTVEVLIPAVISPFTEYIWSLEEHFWLTDSVPRVATVDEIANLLDNRDALRTIVTRSYAVSLSN